MFIISVWLVLKVFKWVGLKSILERRINWANKEIMVLEESPEITSSNGENHCFNSCLACHVCVGLNSDLEETSPTKRLCISKSL